MAKKGCLILCIGIALVIAAFVLCVYIVDKTEKDTVKSGIQMSTAGEHRMVLEKGAYTFFIEHGEDPELALESADFSVKDRSGESLTVSPQSGSKFNLLFGRKGESTAGFTVDTPGEYTIGIRNMPGKCTVTLLKNFEERCQKGYLTGGLTLLGMSFAGIILVIAAFVFFVKAIIQYYASKKNNPLARE